MNVIFLPIISLITTMILTPIVGKFNKSMGCLALTYIKERFEIPEAGGAAILLGTIPIFILFYLITFDISILMFILPVTIIGIIGFIDDVYNIPQYIKTLACLLGAYLLFLSKFISKLYFI